MGEIYIELYRGIYNKIYHGIYHGICHELYHGIYHRHLPKLTVGPFDKQTYKQATAKVPYEVSDSKFAVNYCR